MIGRFAVCFILAIAINLIVQAGLGAVDIHGTWLNHVIGFVIGAVTYMVMSDWINDR